MAVLGIDEHRWLDFEDGTLDTVEVARGAAIVEDLLGELRPDTVVTFGPDGMTGHPDHCAISTWVHRAWRRTGSTARLLWATTTAAFADEFADVHDALGIFPPGLPRLAEPEDITVTVELDEDCADLKLAALRTYATQIQPILDVIGADGLRHWRQTETFREPPSA
jgi:LmbE family N-acetylglucosaminyl deacetylase